VDRGLQERLERQLGAGVTDVRQVGGQHGVSHYRMKLSSGQMAFAKASQARAGDGADSGLGPGGSAPASSAGPGFASEASGLRWLAGPGAAAVPGVLAVDEDVLVIDWIDPGPPTAPAALCYGQELAATHAAGAEAFGAPWPGVIAGLTLPNEPAPPGSGWGEWYAAARLLPFVRLARDRGALTAAEAGLAEAAAGHAPQVAGPAEPPARIPHPPPLPPSCWSGNVLWSGGRGWLIDPAAHGGHRETDLAMLALFGAPYLDQIMAGYQQTAPLAEGWRARVPLHQLHPLLVHCCLFGRSYTDSALAAARAVLAL
jgi:fructosamine-3-kinase